MKLTRKLAIEKVLDTFDERSEWGMSIEEQAYLGVDYGIVLGLQMALDLFRNKQKCAHPSDLEPMIAKRLKKLEKAK
jgi:hypothetical protein